MGKPTVLIAVSEYFPEGPGAVSRFIHLQAVGLAERGYAVHIMAHRGTWKGRLQIENRVTATCVSVVRDWQGPQSRLGRVIWYSMYLFWIAKLLVHVTCRRSVLLLYGPVAGFAIVAKIARFLRRKSFYLDCDIRIGVNIGRTHSKLIGQTARNVSMIVLGGTNLLVEHFREFAPEVPIRRLWPPTNTAVFSSGNAKDAIQRWGLDGQRVIVYGGAVSTLEGIHLLVEAYARVVDALPDTRLCIAGPIMRTDFIDEHVVDPCKLAEQYNVSDGVILTGHLPIEELTDLMAAADVLVMPKVDHIVNHVAWPIKVGEYLATGRAVVSSRICELDSFLEDRKDILFCEPSNVDDLARALLEVLQDGELRKKLGDNGKRAALRWFDYRVWAESMDAIIQGTLDVDSGMPDQNED